MAQIADNWITTAERLREIRKARDSFLLRWATNVALNGRENADELSDSMAREMIETLPIMDRKTRLFGRPELDD